MISTIKPNDIARLRLERRTMSKIKELIAMNPMKSLPTS